MMRATAPLAVASAAACLLAACDAAPPRPDPKGQQLRAELDQMTKDYAACVDAKVAAADVSNDPAGSIAIEAVKACRPQRNALRLKVASFDRLGHPNHTANQAEAVADASVGVIEKELREKAVVDIVKRQNLTR
jgi:hypothetical protein